MEKIHWNEQFKKNVCAFFLTGWDFMFFFFGIEIQATQWNPWNEFDHSDV